jgi:hypothetical protein
MRCTMGRRHGSREASAEPIVPDARCGLWWRAAAIVIAGFLA